MFNTQIFSETALNEGHREVKNYIKKKAKWDDNNWFNQHLAIMLETATV